MNLFVSFNLDARITDMNTTLTLQLTETDEQRLFEAFSDTQTKAPPYAKWQLRPENCVITCYESGKTVFQGKDAQVYASAFTKTAAEPDPGQIFPQAGSDEVGTGDYFGPVCVCACIVNRNDLPLLEELGIRDSKQLSDNLIRRAAPALMEKLAYSLLIVDPEKYNAVHGSSNMNAIKAKLHNKAYINLAKKTALPSFKVIDQFTPEASYYRYLSQEPEVMGKIRFETKAEDKYPAVGAASVIARYAFLKKMDAMAEQWGMEFAKGSGAPADRCAEEFVRRHGMAALPKAAKMHFKNTEKISVSK